MPTYEYVCEDCGYEFRKIQKMTDEHLKICPKCSAPALKRKIGTGSGLLFKGSGFYCTDYAHKNASPTCPKQEHADAPCEHAHSCGCGCGCKHA